MLAVLAGMVFASALSPATAYAENPHVPATVTSISCPLCHDPHQAAVGDSILKDVKGGTGGLNQVTFCYGCHDTGVINVKTGNNNIAFDGASGHSVEPTSTTADLTHVCADCHNPHADSAMQPRLPRASITVTLTTGVTEEREVTEEPNSWCFACHDDEQSWYTSTTETPYPQLSSPTKVASGYPVTGTFPGEAVYESATNAHANIPAGSMTTSHEATRVAGDCLWCHSGHRGKSEYDGLVDTFGAAKNPASADDLVCGDYAAVCLRCHRASGLVGAAAVDIASKVLADAEDANALTTALNGHRVRSSGGDLPVNSPLPCYMCHNPHGSTRNNKTLLSDSLGANLDTSTDAGMRAFCFTCHTTYDETAGGLPYRWDSVAATYTPVGAADEVAGLPRAADETTKANKLRLWKIARPGHSKDDPQNCITCHLDVHAPMGNVSVGNMECLECHEPMLPMVPGNTGSTDTYHHVLNAENPDAVPGDDPYCVFPEDPETQPWALSCVSCHVDHNKYESADGASDPDKVDGKAFNLRHSARSSDPVASNTDEGLCLSCHSHTLLGRIYRSTDDTTVPGITAVPAGQANNALYATAVMRVEDDMWAGSPHNYTTPGVFDDGSEFLANCAKCHGTLDDATLSYSEPAFTVHFSAEQRLLNALGQDRSSLAAPQTAAINEEDMCFRCHIDDATGKLGGAEYDYYGTEPMGLASRVIGEKMSGNPFGHKPADYYMEHRISSVDETQEYISANKHVECADCHNHHVVGKSRHVYGTTNLVSDALKGVRGVGFTFGLDDTIAATLEDLATQNYPSTINYAADGTGAELEYKQMATYEYEVCFKCHSSANTELAGWGGLMSWTVWPGGTENSPKPPTIDNWTNVAQDFNVGNNSRHPVFATLDGWYYDSQEAYATDLDSGFTTDSKVSIGTAYVDDWSRGTSSLPSPEQVTNGWGQGDTMVCSDCHGDSGAPPPMVWNAATGKWDENSLAEDVPQGPHGASIRFSLRGPRTDWPVVTSAFNYTVKVGKNTYARTANVGDLITLGMVSDSDSYDNLFCANCHPTERFTGASSPNTAHSSGWSNHNTLACVNCHVLVPHGGKMSRLIGDNENMPPRLAYQGDLANMRVAAFTKQTTQSYTKDDCSVSGSCGTHPTGDQVNGAANGTRGTWESW